MKPSPYQISAFTEAARERSFSRAATVLGVTQSAITQHVGKLEALMGSPLFIRRRDGLELTIAGAELFEIADKVRTLDQLIEEKVASFGDLSAGHLRIIANAPRPALPLIAEFSRAHPQIEIDFSLTGWTHAMASLKERNADLAVVTEPDASPILTSTEIDRSGYRAFVRRDHRFAKRRSLTLSDLAEEVLVLPEDGSFTQRIIDRKSREFGVPFPRRLKTSTFPLVKEAVLHGAGVGLMLDDSIYPSRRLAAVPVTEMPETYGHCLVVPGDRRDLRLIQSFREIALAYGEARETVAG